VDERVPLLRGYLQAKDSSLASYAAEMVVAADKYQFDWRLLPAIAGKESSFGKKTPGIRKAKSLHITPGGGEFMEIKLPCFQVGKKPL